jgi:hypothetical protein
MAVKANCMRDSTTESFMISMNPPLILRLAD